MMCEKAGEVTAKTRSKFLQLGAIFRTYSKVHGICLSNYITPNSVYCHRICDRPLLLRLRLVSTIIPLSNAQWQVVVVDVVDVVVVVVFVVIVVVDVVVVRRSAVAVVAIIVIVVIIVRRAIAVAIVVHCTVAVEMPASPACGI